MPHSSHLSGSQCVSQCSTICENCKTMRDIENRLASAEKLVYNLKNERIALLSSVTEKNDPLTSKVPIEITSYIFECYIYLHRKEGNLAEEPTFGFDEIHVGAPLLLGAVCRRWRAIAWDTPALWTKLVVDLLSKGHAHGPELVRQWIERTSECPINVALRLHVDAALRHQEDNPILLEGHQKANAEAIVTVLNKHWPKLKSIDLRDIPWKLATTFYSDSPSVLENLCVGGYLPDEPLTERSPQLFRSSTHKHSPTDLSLLSTIPPTRLNIDWSKLTTLSIDFVTRQNVFDVVTLCAGTLTTIILKSINDDNDDLPLNNGWLPRHVVNLPALIAISFMEMDSQLGFAEILFDHLTAPALRSIWYYGREEDNEMPVDTIISFIRRSSCNIVYLLLHDPVITDDNGGYMPLLRAMPGLRILDFSLRAELSVEPLFLALADRDPRTDRPTFLPHLKKLVCRARPTFDWVLFPEIWVATHPNGHQIGDLDFKYSEMCVARARAKLSTELTLRGPLGEENYVDADALLGLMTITAQITSEITVKLDAKGDDTQSGGPRRGPTNFLERSFLYSFPMDARPEHLALYQGAKAMGLF